MVIQVLTADLMDDRTERLKRFISVTNPTIDVQSGRSIASLNISAIMRPMTTLPLFKIRTNQERVSPNENRELSQLLRLARSEDQENSVG